jgi:hypothetical protein
MASQSGRGFAHKAKIPPTAEAVKIISDYFQTLGDLQTWLKTAVTRTQEDRKDFLIVF